MVGRLAYQNPFELMKVDELFSLCQTYKKRYADDQEARFQIMMRYAEYVQKLERGEITDEFGNGIRKPNPSVLVKPIINWYNGEKYSGKYRQYLQDFVKLKKEPTHQLIRNAAKFMKEGAFRYRKDKETEKGEKGEEKRQDKEEKEEVLFIKTKS